MTGLELRISVVGSDRSINFITTTALMVYFRLFYKQLTVNKCSIKFANDCIRTRVLWYRKRPLCQLHHDHCPNSLNVCNACLLKKSFVMAHSILPNGTCWCYLIIGTHLLLLSSLVTGSRYLVGRWRNLRRKYFLSKTGSLQSFDKRKFLRSNNSQLDDNDDDDHFSQKYLPLEVVK